MIILVHDFMKLNDDEILIKKGSANHLVQFEGVGGRLFLTNQRLFFKSHSFNIQTHEESILLDDIIWTLFQDVFDFVKKWFR